MNQPKHLRFLNEGLAATIARVFFNNNSKWGIGSHPSVGPDLRKLSSTLIGYIGAIMRGAILEYNDEGGQRKGELSVVALERKLNNLNIITYAC